MPDAHGEIERPAGEPPPEHPYAALALALALSGSPRWETSPGGAHDDGGAASSDATSSEGGVIRRRRRRPSSSSDEPLEGGLGKEEHGEDGELAGFGGDSSRLWSDDGEEDDEENEGNERRDAEEEKEEEAEGRRPPVAPLAPVEDVGERDTQEWLQAFESDGERSPRTDGKACDRAFSSLSFADLKLVVRCMSSCLP